MFTIQDMDDWSFRLEETQKGGASWVLQPQISTKKDDLEIITTITSGSSYGIGQQSRWHKKTEQRFIDSLIQNPVQRPCVVRGQRDGGMKREMLGCGRWHRGCWVGSRCKEPSNQTKVSRVIYFEGTKIYGSRLFLKELSQL